MRIIKVPEGLERSEQNGHEVTVAQRFERRLDAGDSCLEAAANCHRLIFERGWNNSVDPRLIPMMVGYPIPLDEQ